MVSDIRRWPTTCFVALALSVFAAAPAGAQALLQWPDTAVDVARYTTVEQCLAAAQRTQTHAEQAAIPLVRNDTIPPRDWRMAPAPDVVTATARRCAARFQEPNADLADYALLLKLFLLAGRDTDAVALVTRRVAAAQTSAAREAAIDTAFDAYTVDARPVRREAATALLQARFHRLQDPGEQLHTSFQLFLFQTGWDTLGARKTAEEMLALYASLTPVQREDVRHLPLFPGALAAVLAFIDRKTVLDSLRKSTAAYLALIRAGWTQVTGERPEVLDAALRPMGLHAPKIAGDFWFPVDSGRVARPAPGRVTLVEFFDDQSMALRWSGDPAYQPYTGAWQERLIPLRRLTLRFPALQVILLARTHGSFVYDTMPSAVAEAEWIHRAVEANGGPRDALLAVSSTPFWRLPAPDLRRIDQTVINDTSYTFGGVALGVNQTFEFLVDQDGIVVYAGPPQGVGLGHLSLDLMIDALLYRGGSRGSAAKRAAGPER